MSQFVTEKLLAEKKEKLNKPIGYEYQCYMSTVIKKQHENNFSRNNQKKTNKSSNNSHKQIHFTDHPFFKK